MSNPLWQFLSGAFKPFTKLIDELHTSTDEKLAAQNALETLHNAMASQLLDYQSKLMQAQADIIKAEAQGASWLQRSWRPITMLTFLALVVLDAFDLLAFRLAGEAWTLLQIGLGGYVIGRSVEKTAPAFASAIGKK